MREALGIFTIFMLTVGFGRTEALDPEDAASATPIEHLVIFQENRSLEPYVATPPARCGYGPHLPLLIISPNAKQNYVSHVLADQSSITRFIEDNWLAGKRISKTSFDDLTGSLLDMFDFEQTPAPPLFLEPSTGLPVGTP